MMKQSDIGRLAVALATGLALSTPVNADPKAGGRIHLDFALYDEDATVLNDGFRVRRARLGLSDKLDDRWSYKTEVDFAENSVEAKDMYLKFDDMTIGQVKVPFSLEEMTSSNNITFMERAAPNLFSLAHRIGVRYGRAADNYTITAMAFGQAIGAGDGGDEGTGFAGRVTWVPVMNDDTVVHLGAAAIVYEPVNSANEALRFRQRPESRPDGSRLIDTGSIPADSATAYGLEGAWANGPFSLQGEYMATSVDVIGGPDADFDGYYVFGSWFITGESRRYSKGAFSGPKVADAAKGAWEVALRYSNVNLDDGAILGGEMKNVTLGVNWYARSGVRFMFNYIDVASEVAGVVDDPSILQFRTQVSF